MFVKSAIRVKTQGLKPLSTLHAIVHTLILARLLHCLFLLLDNGLQLRTHLLPLGKGASFHPIVHRGEEPSRRSWLLLLLFLCHIVTVVVVLGDLLKEGRSAIQLRAHHHIFAICDAATRLPPAARNYNSVPVDEAQLAGPFPKGGTRRHFTPQTPTLAICWHRLWCWRRCWCGSRRCWRHSWAVLRPHRKYRPLLLRTALTKT